MSKASMCFENQMEHGFVSSLSRIPLSSMLAMFFRYGAMTLRKCRASGRGECRNRKPLDELVDEQSPAKYPEYKAGKWLNLRMYNNYKKHGFYMRMTDYKVAA
ncbi:protein DMR6-LIKE OXYGENASE 1 isoform X2 [Prunus yedoensis var. nudiflora]|uniref:Protein DMR6-LIKE OXYGENASE 1 isoform X2 n=1 Tax=Prunus yedoensis var. nudiflora TaxID=2094558 RepID=A0A314XMI4_PRUYE|nr:protein DMR6-LIKE OXYGENASE 1 isoform X2 [Prunus yedoensis var. nudiflora]